MGEAQVAVLKTAPEQWREKIALELDAAARRVRESTGRPLAVGIVLIISEDGDRCVYTEFEGVDSLGLIAGAHMLARRIDDELERVPAGPAPEEEPHDE